MLNCDLKASLVIIVSYIFTLTAWKIAIRTAQAQQRLIFKVQKPALGFYLYLEVSISVKIFEFYLVTQSQHRDNILKKNIFYSFCRRWWHRPALSSRNLPSSLSRLWAL